jgi:MFS family permease
MSVAIGAGLRGGFNSTVRAMRVRNYRLYWFGQLVSLSGTWMQRVAQSWLVLQLTDSPLALGTVTALQFLPISLLSLFGGVLADRVPKRRLLMVTQSIQIVQAVAIAVLAGSGAIQLWHIYALAAVLGLANAFDTPARQSMLAEMVGPRDLSNAVALQSSLFNAARIVGPALAGGIIATVGVTACFWLNAASYLAVIAALAAMRPADFFDLPAPSRGRVLGQLRDGLAYALKTREVCLVIIMLGALGAFGYNFNTFIPLLARYALDSDAAGFGLLFSCLGLGSVVAGLLIASREQVTERTLFVGAGAFTGLLGLVAVSPSFALTAALLIVLGAASTVFSATANTRMQLAAPIELRGRVMSIFTLLTMGSTPIGSPLIGMLAEYQGIRVALCELALLCALGVVAGLVYARRSAGRAALGVAESRTASP